MTFAWPWAFLGLLALPVLAAIYWLRQRARRRPVSSLLLWRDAPQSRSSGRRVERFEASRLLPLELLILALLVAAAAGPQLPSKDARRPLVVVLDDSFSMLAGGDQSPRDVAAAALLQELGSDRHGAVTLVAAGQRPRVLGAGTPGSTGEVAGRLELWRPSSPSANLEAAIALAFDLGGGRSRILVLSDHPPPEEPVGRLGWWTFGRRLPNLALVGAVRSPEGRAEAADGCLVEVANFSTQAAVARLTAAVGGGSPEEAARLELGAGEVDRVRFDIATGKEVRLRLTGGGAGGDALAIDDQAILLPERRRAVRVGLEIGDPGVDRQVRRALAASGRAILAGDRPELVITDVAGVAEAEGAWHLRLVTGGTAVPYLGPFVLDRGHPLTAGLGLEGVIWGAGQGAGEAVEGTPVVTAGDQALLTDREAAGGRHRLAFHWQPDLSTLQRTPNWPILWSNLLEWRARSVPGVRSANLRLGGEAIVGLVESVESAELELPDGSRRRLAARVGSLTIAAEQTGIHRLRHGGRSDRWAVNALAAAESDLRRAAGGRWGDWRDGAAVRWQRRGIGWALLLVAAAGLVLHLVWSRPPHPNPLPRGERGPDQRGPDQGRSEDWSPA